MIIQEDKDTDFAALVPFLHVFYLPSHILFSHQNSSIHLLLLRLSITM